MSRNEKPGRLVAEAPKSTEDGERIAKYLARAGVCSRRDAERLIAEGKVTVDGKTLDTPAFKVNGQERITVEGRVIGPPRKAKLWRFYKPLGLVVSHKDEQGRETVFDWLKRLGLPRVVSIGRLDLNSEGLLLLTTDGGLARQLELPATGWVRRYRVRLAGALDRERLDALKQGITIDGLRYGPIKVEIERTGGVNSWATVALTEGKNREIRRVMEHLGLGINRLIREAYGPFDLGQLKPGEVVPVGEAVVASLLEGDFTVSTKKPEPRPVPRKPAAAAAAAVPALGKARTTVPANSKPARPRDGRPAAVQADAGKRVTGKASAGRSGTNKPSPGKPRGNGPVDDRPARGVRDHAHRRRP